MEKALRIVKGFLPHMCMVFLFLLFAVPAFAANTDPACQAWAIIQAFFPFLVYGIPAFVGTGAAAGGVYEIKKEHAMGLGLGLITVGIIVAVLIYVMLNSVYTNAVQQSNFCS